MIKSLEINEKLEKYISDHSYDLHSVQKDILNHNNKLGDIKKLQISTTQAYFFQFLIKTNNIKEILEIGTFTGYSALSMGLAIPRDGHITCLDVNKETSEVAEHFFKKAKIDQKINIIIAPALDSLKKLKNQNKTYDMIFIDADKENYVNYYNLSLDLLKDKGFILIDNVLWKGEVVRSSKNDKFTDIIREFNSFSKKDDRVEKTILPLGDGITICRKV